MGFSHRGGGSGWTDDRWASLTGLLVFLLILFLGLFIYFMRHHSIPLFLLFNSFHFPNHFLSIFQPFPPPFATIANHYSPPLLSPPLPPPNLSCKFNFNEYSFIFPGNPRTFSSGTVCSASVTKVSLYAPRHRQSSPTHSNSRKWLPFPGKFWGVFGLRTFCWVSVDLG